MDSFVLFQLGVDADGVEQSLAQQLRQLLCSINLVHENYDLVDGEFVEKVAQLLELLSLIQ